MKKTNQNQSTQTATTATISLKAKQFTNGNTEGIELYFSAKPDYKVIGDLKKHGFRWHSQKECWFRRVDANVLKYVASLNQSINGAPAKQEKPEAKAKATAKAQTSKKSEKKSDVNAELLKEVERLQKLIAEQNAVIAKILDK